MQGSIELISTVVAWDLRRCMAVNIFYRRPLYKLYHLLISIVFHTLKCLEFMICYKKSFMWNTLFYLHEYGNFFGCRQLGIRFSKCHKTYLYEFWDTFLSIDNCEKLWKTNGNWFMIGFSYFSLKTFELLGLGQVRLCCNCCNYSCSSVCRDALLCKAIQL